MSTLVSATHEVDNDAVSSHDVEVAIDSFPTDQAAALRALRETLQSLLPGAVETIAWGMPTFKVGPDQVVSYSGFAHHNSIFPGAATSAAISGEFPGLVTTKGTVHLDRDRATPTKLIRRIVALRIAEINDSYPRANGKTRRYYSNGVTEYTGVVRDGLQHGSWEWFRRDGTLKRSGRFARGEQIGEWTTYDTAGEPYRVTRMG